MAACPIGKEIQKLKTVYRDNKVLSLLEKYKSKNKFHDYESALDSFAFKFGMTMLAQPVFNEAFEVTEYIPIVKLYPDNALNKEPEQLKFSGYKTRKKCEMVAAKELLHTLLKIDDPEKYLN